MRIDPPGIAKPFILWMMNLPSILQPLLFLLVILLLYVGIVFIVNRPDKSDPEDTAGAKQGSKSKATAISTIVFCTLTVTILAIYGVFYAKAFSKGMPIADLYRESTLAISERICALPDESELPEDLTGCIVIVYRWGCQDCDDVMPVLRNRLSENPAVYYCSSRSPQGKALLEQYPVAQVPAGIYIAHDPGLNYVQQLLFDPGTDDGPSTLNENALDVLLDFQRNAR